MNISMSTQNFQKKARSLKWVVPALLLTGFVSCGEQEPLGLREATPQSSAANRTIITPDTNAAGTNATASSTPDSSLNTSPNSSASANSAGSTPMVLRSTPADMSTRVASDTREIVAIFSEPMDAETINEESFTIACMGNPLPGEVSYAANTNVATLTLPGNLPADSNCVATISRDVRDTSGSAMRDEFSWSFVTDSENPNVPLSSTR